MYNDYYLSSIDNKLGGLNDIIQNQETIISNQETIISNQETIGSILNIGFTWLYLILFLMVFYNFIHRILNHK